MRILFLLLITLFGVTSQSQAKQVSPCVAQIATNEHWVNLTDAQFGCIENKPDFDSVVKVLCASEQSNISGPYKKFLDFSVRIQGAWAKFQSATNPGERSLANLELQELKQDQSTYAYTHGIWDALNAVNAAKYACEQL